MPPENSITTKQGDTGSTDIMFGGRVTKDDIRIHAVGLVDELTASLGLVRVEACSQQTQVWLGKIQEELIGLMGICSVMQAKADRYTNAGYKSISQEHIDDLTQAAGSLEQALPKFTTWVLPGAKGNVIAAKLDMARTICRRAERYVVSLHLHGEPHLVLAVTYLNRLSDFLWILARMEEEK